jgi:hypothetical protein
VLRGLQRRGLLAALDESARLSALLPELGSGPAPLEDAPAARFALFDTLALALGRVAADSPLVVVLDDLQWADPASIGFLRFLGRQLARLPLVVVGGYRDTEPLTAALGGALADLAPVTRHVELVGLSVPEVEQLVTAVTGEQPAPTTAAEIHVESGGNPLFVVEVARLLRTGTAMGIPRGVRDVILRRLERLPPEAVTALHAASVLGNEFALHELASLRAETETATWAALAPAAEARLVSAPAEGGTVRFSHDLLRRVVLESVPPPERMRLHRAIGQMLERDAARRQRETAPRIAHHLLAAGPGDAGETVQWAVRAAAEARAGLAFDDEVRWLRAARRLVDEAGGAGGEQLGLLLRLAQAEWDAGDGSARATFLEAAAAAGRQGDAAALARAAVGASRSVPRFFRHPAVVERLEQARAALASTDPLLVEVLSRLAMMLLPWPERAAERERISEEAVALARRVGDAKTVCDALRSQFQVIHRPSTVLERTALADEQVALAAQAADPRAAVEAALNMVICGLELGDLERTNAALLRLEVLAEDLKRPLWRFYALTRGATLALLEGRYDEARRREAEAHGVAERTRPADTERVLVLQRLTRLLDVDEPGLDETVDRLQEFYDSAPTAWIAWGFGAEVALGRAVLGQHAAARALVEEQVLRLDDPAVGMFWGLGPAVDLAEACARLDFPDPAARLLAFLGPYGEHVGVVGRAFVCRGPVALAQGVAATLAGLWDEAEAHLRRAEAVSRRMGARAWAVRVAAAQAAMAGRRRGEGDGDRARALRAAAHRAAVELGMTRVARELDAAGSGQGRASAARVPRRGARLVLDGGMWTVSDGTSTVRLRDGKGLRYVADLVAHPWVERHALDLVALADGAVVEGFNRRRLGDAGAMLDDAAKASYRGRLRDLREDLEEAEAFNDDERAAQAKAEIDALVGELSRAVGLGGRDRRAASAAERARVNVTRAIRSAIDNIEEGLPELGRHLDRRVRTGLFSAYEPQPEDGVTWERAPSPAPTETATVPAARHAR